MFDRRGRPSIDLNIAQKPAFDGRIEWIDAARGLGVILVVFGHVERGLVGAGLGGDWRLADFALYTFHMPLFFMLAGLNAARGVLRGRLWFLRGKIATVAYPYFLWSVIQGVLLISAASFTNGKADLRDLLKIGWQPMGQFWFLYVLMLCHIALVLLNLRGGLLVVIGVVAFTVSQFMPDNTLAERFLYSLPFFLFGVAFGKEVKSIGEGAGWPLPLALSVLFGFAVWFAWLVDRNDYSAVTALPATILGMATLLTAARLFSGFALSCAASVGVASMTIYVMHIIVAAGLRIALVKLGVPHAAWAFALVCTAAGVALPMAAHRILARLGLLPVLGLAAPARSASIQSHQSLAAIESVRTRFER